MCFKKANYSSLTSFHNTCNNCTNIIELNIKGIHNYIFINKTIGIIGILKVHYLMIK